MYIYICYVVVLSYELFGYQFVFLVLKSKMSACTEVLCNVLYPRGVMQVQKSLN